MVNKEAAGVVDQQLVELRLNRIVDAQGLRRFGDKLRQGLVPAPSPDRYLLRIDLPGAADVTVDQCLLAAAIWRRFGSADELSGLFGGDRKADPAYSGDIDRWHDDVTQSANAVATRPFDRAHQV